MMERRLALRSIACNYTPAGLHNKPVERAIQTLKSKMRAMKADLDYQLPTHLTGELLAAAVSAINATPNSRSGPFTTPYTLVTKKRPHLKKFKFGQVGLCECRRQDSPDTRAEWASTWERRATRQVTSGCISPREVCYIREDPLKYLPVLRLSPSLHLCPRSGTTLPG